MQYAVTLKKRTYEQDNDHYWFRDSLLAPNSEFDSISSAICEESGLCEKCYEICDQSSHCHILRLTKDDYGYEVWDKLCPILFCDIVKPPFQVKDIV